MRFKLQLFSVLLLAVVLSGCVSYRYTVLVQDPAFDFGVLKRTPSVLIASPENISLYDFSKTFVNVYQTNEKFMDGLVYNLTTNLKSSGFNIVADHHANAYNRILYNDSIFST